MGLPQQCANIHQVESRIIIDAHAWNRFNPGKTVSLNSLDRRPAGKKGKANLVDSYDDPDYDDYDHDHESGDDTPPDETGEPNKVPLAALTRDQLLICSRTVKGYSLKNKKWCKLRSRNTTIQMIS